MGNTIQPYTWLYSTTQARLWLSIGLEPAGDLIAGTKQKSSGWMSPTMPMPALVLLAQFGEHP
jgi:hypothetical protein